MLIMRNNPYHPHHFDITSYSISHFSIIVGSTSIMILNERFLCIGGSPKSSFSIFTQSAEFSRWAENAEKVRLFCRWSRSEFSEALLRCKTDCASVVFLRHEISVRSIISTPYRGKCRSATGPLF